MIEEIQEGIKELKCFLFWRGKFITEGSASLEELVYLDELTRKVKTKLIGEIGFNAGFSSYAFLAVAPDIKVISFDSGAHYYVKTAKKYIDRKFPGRHTLIYGDSKETIPKFKIDNPDIFFDLIFVDGSHKYEDVKSDIHNMKQLATEKTAVVIDDLTPWLPWGKGPTKAWLEAIDQKIVIQKEMFKDGKPVDKIEPPGQRSWALGHYLFNQSNFVVNEF